MSDITRVGIVGCGLMGSGIAEVCARAGLDVLVREIDDDALASGRVRLEKSLKRALDAGKITQEAFDAARGRLGFYHQAGGFHRPRPCHRGGHREPRGEERAVRRVRPDRRAPRRDPGLQHLFHPHRPHRPGHHPPRPGAWPALLQPAPVQKLVEIVPSLLTDQRTIARTRVFATEVLGKTAITAPDRAGFVVNALLVPYLLSAIRMVEAGHATAENNDTGMTLGCAHPMGPLRLCDLIGLDTLKAIADSLYAEFKDPQYAAPPLLCRMVEAGFLGRKSGRGFHEYPA